MEKQNNVKSTVVTGGECTQKALYSEASIKELIGKPEVQAALAKYIDVPNPVVIKKVRNPYKNEGTTTQKIEGVSGTSLMDMIPVNFTLVDTELDPVKSINKLYRITDYTFALDANMAGGKFNGYSAKGLKLMVTKIEEVKGAE